MSPYWSQKVLLIHGRNNDTEHMLESVSRDFIFFTFMNISKQRF
jgi:hypothetical protein